MERRQRRRPLYLHHGQWPKLISAVVLVVVLMHRWHYYRCQLQPIQMAVLVGVRLLYFHRLQCVPEDAVGILDFVQVLYDVALPQRGGPHQ